MTNLDPRINPFNEKIAAAYLKGQVKANAYAEPTRNQINVPIAPLYKSPLSTSMMETQLVFGCEFDVYEQQGSWAWGQEVQENGHGYVGYVPNNALTQRDIIPTHRICSLRAPAFSKPDMKTAIHLSLPMNAKLLVADEEGDYFKIRDIGYVHKNHMTELGQEPHDFVEAAELHFGLPYIWGGISSDGLDCSGLVQTALRATGKDAPRDTDMQETALGKPVGFNDELHGLDRGDLVFWKGHVGIMGDAHMLLHANAYHMGVAIEPLREAVERITDIAGSITSIKRLG